MHTYSRSSLHGASTVLDRMIRASALIAPLFFATPASAQDARSIMQTMMKTYRDLNSYEGRADTDRREWIPNGRVLFDDSSSVLLQFQKPARLKLVFTMPTGGRTVSYDGTSLSIYLSRQQTYSTMPVTAASLKDLAPGLLRFQVVARLDALYFLAGNDLPSTVSGLKRLADDARNGRPVYVVTAREMNAQTKIPITWTWMIDKERHLLSKVEARVDNMTQRVRVMENRKQVLKDIKVSSILLQSIVEAKPNPSLDPSFAKFTAPGGAKKIDVTTPPSSGVGR